MRCTVQPDGTFRTTSNDVIMCPDETYCDHNYGDFECDSPVIPSTGKLTFTLTFILI